MQSFIASAVCCPSASGHPAGSDCQYQIAWTLNPHMVVGSADPARARAQHADLLTVARGLGANIIEVPFVHGAFDSVFAKDNALYVARNGITSAIMASPRYQERQAEQAARACALFDIGVDVISPKCPFEGGDVLIHGDVALLGHGFRSATSAVPTLERLLGSRVIALELVDPLLYHLDTALTVLRDGTVLYCEEAFTPTSARLIRDSFNVAISVPRDAAATFALNIVEIGDTIVTGTECTSVNSVFRALGRDVIVVPVDEFQRAGGSVACLLGPVHEREAVEQRSAA
jgi:N-dimethylarginine dimethylaminohydrolase